MYSLELLYLCLPFSDDSLYLWFEAFHSCLLDPLGFFHSPLLMMQLVCRCCHLSSLGQFHCIAGKWTELCWTNLELKSNLFQTPPPQILWQEEIWKTFSFSKQFTFCWRAPGPIHLWVLHPLYDGSAHLSSMVLILCLYLLSISISLTSCSHHSLGTFLSSMSCEGMCKTLSAMSSSAGKIKIELFTVAE